MKFVQMFFFLTWLFSTMVQILLTCVKGILFLHCVVSRVKWNASPNIRFFIKHIHSFKCYWSQYFCLSWYQEMVNRGCAVLFYFKFNIVMRAVKWRKGCQVKIWVWCDCSLDIYIYIYIYISYSQLKDSLK